MVYPYLSTIYNSLVFHATNSFHVFNVNDYHKVNTRNLHSGKEHLIESTNDKQENAFRSLSPGVSAINSIVVLTEGEV